jgi:hypothetical protein
LLSISSVHLSKTSLPQFKKTSATIGMQVGDASFFQAGKKYVYMILFGAQYLSISFISRPSICIKTISQSFDNNANLQNASTSTSFSPSLRRNSYSRHCSCW